MVFDGVVVVSLGWCVIDGDFSWFFLIENFFLLRVCFFCQAWYEYYWQGLDVVVNDVVICWVIIVVFME